MSGSRAWRAVAVSMAAGAVYDLVFAGAILFATAPAAAILGLEVPADPVYLRLNGVFLVLLAGLYLLPAVQPRRYRGVVLVAACGRALGFLYLAFVWWQGRPPVFLLLALADLAFAAAHALLLARAARGEGSGSAFA